MGEIYPSINVHQPHENVCPENPRLGPDRHPSLAFLTACHSRKDITINGMPNNQTKGTAYVWLGHKEKPEPSDLLGPGEFKPVMITLNAYTDDDIVEEIEDLVKANGSNDGTKIVHDDLQLDKTYKGDRNPYVRWNGSQLLGY